AVAKTPAPPDPSSLPSADSAIVPDGSALDEPPRKSILWGALAFPCLLGIGLAAPAISNLTIHRFPWESLVFEKASLRSSLDYNPYANYPPEHRLELGIQFKELVLPQSKRPYAPFLSYTLNLGNRGWKELPGTHDLQSTRGSDFWHDDVNLGP